MMAGELHYSPGRLGFGPGFDPDGRPTVLLAAGTQVLADVSYDVGEGPDGTVPVTGGPGPISVRFGPGVMPGGG